MTWALEWGDSRSFPIRVRASFARWRKLVEGLHIVVWVVMQLLTGYMLAQVECCFLVAGWLY